MSERITLHLINIFGWFAWVIVWIFVQKLCASVTMTPMSGMRGEEESKLTLFYITLAKPMLYWAYCFCADMGKVTKLIRLISLWPENKSEVMCAPRTRWHFLLLIASPLYNGNSAAERQQHHDVCPMLLERNVLNSSKRWKQRDLGVLALSYRHLSSG